MATRKRLLRRVTLAFLALGSPVHAADCAPGTRTSTCFDADALWSPAAPSRFRSIPSSRAPAARTLSMGLDLTYLSRPVTLEALAADPNGRTVLVVDDVVDASLAAAYSPAPHLELGLVVPAALYRTGTGLSGVTSQTGPALATSALRDVRLGAGYDLVLSQPRTTGDLDFSAMSRLDLALPTGGASSFAGDRGPVVAPSVVIGLGIDRVRFVAEEGARLRSGVDFGGVRLGSQFLSSLGASVELIPRGLLGVSLEAWILPNFLSTSRTLPDGTFVESGALVPSEWLGSVWTEIAGVMLAGGAGTAIPLSHETRALSDGTETADHFAGVTAPRFRLVFTARYTPNAP